jgi:radical SAM protein (TIGR01212 family)
MNPFPYSADNKRYHTFNYDLRMRYGSKVYRVPLNTNLSCPNRDGTCGLGGCSFCNEEGSGEFAGNPKDDLMKQYGQGKAMMSRKWPDARPIAYFQAFTNTYAPLETLKTFFEPFVEMEEVIALAIATRADCLSDETIVYLDSLCDKKDIYLELGLQSIHDVTAKAMNRGHDYQTFLNTYQKLQSTRLKTVIHIMNGYPNEARSMMVETAKAVGSLKPYGIKIHMLNVLDHTALGAAYQLKPFKLLDQEEYEELVIHQLQHIPPEVVIMRLTGDGDANDVLAPEWVKNKVSVLNGIDKKMARRNLVQGDLL